MAENITINFAGHQVGVKYNAETSEAVFHDEVIAIEIGVQVLAAQAILNWQKEGRPVPAVFVALVEAHTFKDLLCGIEFYAKSPLHGTATACRK